MPSAVFTCFSNVGPKLEIVAYCRNMFDRKVVEENTSWKDTIHCFYQHYFSTGRCFIKWMPKHIVLKKKEILYCIISYTISFSNCLAINSAIPTTIKNHKYLNRSPPITNTCGNAWICNYISFFFYCTVLQHSFPINFDHITWLRLIKYQFDKIYKYGIGSIGLVYKWTLT